MSFNGIRLSEGTYVHHWSDSPLGSIVVLRHVMTTEILSGIVAEQPASPSYQAIRWFVVLDGQHAGRALTIADIGRTPAIVLSPEYHLSIETLDLTDFTGADLKYGKLYGVEHAAGSDAVMLCFRGSSPGPGGLRGVVANGVRKGVVVEPQSLYAIGTIAIKRLAQDGPK